MTTPAPTIPREYLARHPVMPLPTREQATANGADWTRNFLIRRAEAIAKEIDNPLVAGYIPPMWRVVNALVGFNPHVGTAREDEVFAWQLAMRKHLTFDKPVRTVLINGGNGTGKTRYTSIAALQIALQRQSQHIWMFHETEQQSIDIHHRSTYDCFPPYLRGSKKLTQKEYISYTDQNGFAGGKVTFDNRSYIRYLNYGKQIKTLEGGGYDLVVCSELVPEEWIDTLSYRVARKKGIFIIEFTPLQGFSPAVARFVTGATTVKSSIAYMLPADNGRWDLPRTLGFASQADLDTAATYGPESIPENVDAWLTGQPSQPLPPPGRNFHTVPRVMKCVVNDLEDPGAAVVFFHAGDNPFGNPKDVVMTAAKEKANVEKIKTRVYGLATRSLSAYFSTFNRAVHVIPHDKIPAQGTNYHLIDPASGRNFAMLWARRHPDGSLYIYREWPCPATEIPGVGYPGRWALPSGNDPDGAKGPAQKSYNWGLADYKREIARLEKWTSYNPEDPRANIPNWRTAPTDPEPILMRWVDSRPASSVRIVADRPTTFITDLVAIGLLFCITPGDDIVDGCSVINDMLAYDKDRPIDFTNTPRLFISDQCENIIFALETWVGWKSNGHMNMTGATKDWIDLLRYLVLLKPPYIPTGLNRHDPGGHYS
jgi:hypothetical protein